MENNFGKLIRKMRKEKGYTVVEFSRLSGFTKEQIRNIESGRNKPRIFNLNRLADALDCSYEFLFEKLNEN